MKRKMVYIGLSYIIGLFFASFFIPGCKILTITVIILALMAVCCIFKMKIRYFILCLVFFAAGSGVYIAFDRCVYNDIVKYDGCSVSYTGVIKDIKNYPNDKSLYKLSGKINSYKKADIIYYGDTLKCTYRDTLELSCVMSGFENTFLFAEKDYYEADGFFLRTDKINDVRVIKNNRFSPVRSVLCYRDYLNDKITRLLPDENGAVVTAVLFGDKSGLGDDVRAAIGRCGTGHAMSVSGMHLVFAVSLLAAGLKSLKISKYLRFAVIECGIAAFVIFTGMPVSVIRAAVMLTLIYGAMLFNRQTDPLNSLCIAVFILTLAQPFIIKNSSFLLSVAGTFGVGVFAPFVTGNMETETLIGKWKQRLASMLCISAAVFPLSVVFFDETSLIAPFTNIFFIPLFVFVLLCGLITAFTGGIDIIMYPAMMAGGVASKLIIKISEWLASSGYVSMALGYGYLPVIVVLLTAFVAFTSLKFKKGTYTALSVLISCAVLFASGSIYRYINRDIVSVYRTGTKKSASVIIERNGKADIIDMTGGGKSAEYTLKLLNRYGIREINSLTFIKNPYQSMTAYTERLSMYNVKHVYVPDGTYIYDDIKICGCSPELTDVNHIKYLYSDYSVTTEEDSTLTVTYGSSHLKCSPDEITCGGCENIYTDLNMTVKTDSSGNADIYSLE